MILYRLKNLHMARQRKFLSDHFTTTWMRAERNFHQMLITMEKSFVKWVPGHQQTWYSPNSPRPHYSDIIMSTITSQITSLTIVYSTVYSDQRKHQSSASLAFVREIHRWPVNSPHKGPVTWKTLLQKSGTYIMYIIFLIIGQLNDSIGTLEKYIAIRWTL